MTIPARVYQIKQTMIRRQTLKQYKRRCKKAMYWMEIEFVPSPLPNKNDKSQNFPPLCQCSPSYFSEVASSHVMRNEKMYTLYLLDSEKFPDGIG